MSKQEVPVWWWALAAAAPIAAILGVVTTAEAARVLKVPERRELSERDREFVRGELGWIAEWIRERYPEMSYRQIKRVIRDILEVTI